MSAKIFMMNVFPAMIGAVPIIILNDMYKIHQMEKELKLIVDINFQQFDKIVEKINKDIEK